LSKEYSYQKIAPEVKKEIKWTLRWMAEHGSRLDDQEIAAFVNEIIKAKKRIFVTGKGRSGLVGRAFAMRLVHLGYDARDLAEDTAPPVKKGDLFIIWCVFLSRQVAIPPTIILP
jgi:6-phospho-3-hexuloisomerase